MRLVDYEMTRRTIQIAPSAPRQPSPQMPIVRRSLTHYAPEGSAEPLSFDFFCRRLWLTLSSTWRVASVENERGSRPESRSKRERCM